MHTQKENRRKEALQYQRLGVVVAVVGLLLTLAAVISPVIVVLVAGK
jgi:hypothetical protein